MKLPELPEVQTIVDDLNKEILGCRIIGITTITGSIWRRRCPPGRKIIHATVTGIGRKGKHIFMHLSNGRILIVHLGMTGQLKKDRSNIRPGKHTHLIIEFEKFDLHYDDVRRFGFLDLVNSGDLDNVSYLSKLGPDPLEIDEEKFVDLIKSKKRMLKPLLLDQSVISGLGNIYSDEALFRAGINPKANSRKLRKIRIVGLYRAMREILESAIMARGSSISDYVDSSGGKGGYQDYHAVYGRTGEPCRNCGARIKREIIGGRSAHFCPRCQR